MLADSSAFELELALTELFIFERPERPSTGGGMNVVGFFFFLLVALKY
jgi:hypothetical protein